ncbi:MAG: TolC family outer membrane protein [Pseudomonadota bacterium]
MRRAKPRGIGPKEFLFALMATTACCGLASSTLAGGLLDTVGQALENNPEVEVVKADRLAVDQELRQARAGYFPSIDFEAGIGPEYTDSPTTRGLGDGAQWELSREGAVRLSQMLFDGFETPNEVARQRARVDSAAYRVEEAAEFIALDAIEAHLDVLRTAEIVGLNLDNIAQHERILGLVRRLEDRGGTDVADVRQAESRLESARAALATSRGAAADAMARYQRVVGVPPEDLTETLPPVEALPADREEAASIASVSSPTVLIAAADENASEAELRGSRSNFFPRIDAEISGFRGYDQQGLQGSDKSASARVVLNYNLYRGGADVAREREAFQRVNESRARLRQVREDAEEEARVSYNALLTAREQSVALGAKEVSQGLVRDAYTQQFEIGERDLLDVLDSENELFLDRVNFTTAQYVERFATYRVLAVAGMLLDTLEVSGPREQINIARNQDNLLTPERVEENSVPLRDANAQPLPLTDPLAGAPPDLVPVAKPGQ